MQQADKIEELIIKHIEERLSPSEKEELGRYLEQSPSAKLLAGQLNDEKLLKEKLKQFYAIEQRKPLQNIPGIVKMDKKSGNHLLPSSWLKYSVAAAIIVLIAAGAYNWYSKQDQSANKPNKVAVFKEVLPGSNRAVLTLADGTTIPLDNASRGPVGQQGNTKIIKLSDGQLAYKGRPENDRNAMYNTISTPKGGQYQILLPDGTMVWLNAVSSIRFPVSFDGRTRSVEVEGEVYFEVAPDSKIPFVVKTNGMDIQVLGTSFNINAYSDESAVRTTLVSGSIRVIKGSSRLILKPGQQAQVKNIVTPPVDDETIEVHAAEVADVIAWKNGIFKFGDASIEDIMRQLSRWYDLEVVYKGKVSDRFRTTIPRNAPLSQVLRVLEYTRAVHFETDGNKVIVKQ